MESAKTILWPRLDGLGPDCPLRDFAAMAESLGYRFVTFGKGPSQPVDLDRWREMICSTIKGATAYVVTFWGDLTAPDIAAEVRDQIKNGKRLVVLGPDPGLNSFLIEFDLSFASKKLKALTPPPATLSDGGAIILSAQEQENTLCVAMMQGNSEITFDGAGPVWYGKAASPFFVLPENTKVINEGDYFEEGDVRRTTCAAVWPSGSSKEYRILAFGGSTVSGPFQDLDGEIHPGISANRVFAKNLLRWLVGDLELRHDENGDLILKVHSIEIALFDIIKEVLHSEFGNDWWSKGVPLENRKKAAEMFEERSGRVPKEGCLHFIDLKTIVEKNWRLFEPVFKAEPKKGILDRLNQVNELRNRLSHPMRLKHEPISEVELLVLEDQFNFFQRLASDIKFRARPKNI